MKNNSIVFVAVFALLLLCSGLSARQTTEYEAELVVSGWLKANPQPLGATLSQRVKDVEAYIGQGGRLAYYIVNLEPSGYVIVSADDRVEPIIGFAADGVYDFSFENPLVGLLTADLGGRVESFGNTYYLQAMSGMKTTDSPQGKWRHFIEIAEAPEGGFRLMSLTNPGDIRDHV